MMANSIKAAQMEFIIDREEIALRVIEKQAAKNPELWALLAKPIADIFSMAFTIGAASACASIQKEQMKTVDRDEHKFTEGAALAMVAILTEAQEIMRRHKK